MADGQIPISCLLTAASLHDSQVAIPLATIKAHRVISLYGVMVSGLPVEVCFANIGFRFMRIQYRDTVFDVPFTNERRNQVLAAAQRLGTVAPGTLCNRSHQIPPNAAPVATGPIAARPSKLASATEQT